jgi:hypothetical protein
MKYEKSQRTRLENMWTPIEQPRLFHPDSNGTERDVLDTPGV